MKLSTRLFSKTLKATLVLGVSLLATTIGSIQAKAADMCGFPNLNGKIVYFELANGQRVQLPLARAVNGNKVNSFSADNSDDWKWKVVDDGWGVSFLRVNTNQAFSVENLNVVDRTPIVSWDYQGHGRYLDWNPQAVGGGYYLIRLRHNLNQCLNIPGGANNVWVTTWTCNANDPDQRFKIVEVSQTSSPIAYFDQRVNETFTVTVNIIRAGLSGIIYSGQPIKDTADIGHSWITLRSTYSVDKVGIQNGREISRVRTADGVLETQTLSASAPGVPVPFYGSSWERKMTNYHFASGESRMQIARKDIGMDKGTSYADALDSIYGKRYLSFRTKSISKSAYLRFLPSNMGGQNQTAGQCTSYNLLPDNDPTTCHCTSFATKLYSDATGNGELDSFIPSVVAPNALGNRIDALHGWNILP
jgi:hypothetical protein